MTLNQTHKGVEYWTKRISEQEMPALCSTVRDLEKLAKDDVSSLTQLGRSVMHDNALTSKILRVANSAIYNKGINHVSTVSRAAVVLGFDTIRNICITARLLSSMLENHNLSNSVFQRLLKLMAQSFHSAMIARMMMGDRDDVLREEVFIASLLYRIGESAFWSSGGVFIDEVDAKLSATDDPNELQSIIRNELGASFNQLSQGIARSWGLGDMLLKSLTNPDVSMPEIRCIYLADKLAELVAQPKVNQALLDKHLKQAAEMVDVSVEEFTLRFTRCGQATQKLALDYGANPLVAFIPNVEDVLQKLAEPPEIESIRETDLNYQLAKLRQLTQFAIQKTDFNQIMQTALEGILLGVGVDRCGVLLLSPNRKLLQPRVMMGDDSDAMKATFLIELDDTQSVFSLCVTQKKPQWIVSPSTESNNKLAGGNVCNDKLLQRLSREGFIIAPLMVGNKVLGVFYADRNFSFRRFEQTDFDAFTHFSQLANVCFTQSLS
ncbi:HDOD domain-containing protein [Shewanella aestuarii]|uniref:HDOD domain-containing protein n=1 Tax=Shewanella aestuarii TaxID=1028752 RepID=A0A6G9QIJ6_9GAMM|nr:HDOD domain-containing protein [Shewanella aestuarii]QIR13885.1 HDOD domain-containing protein [Shewanella aestuarii]